MLGVLNYLHHTHPTWTTEYSRQDMFN